MMLRNQDEQTPGSFKIAVAVHDEHLEFIKFNPKVREIVESTSFECQRK